MSDDYYAGGWFGESWGAPVNDPELHKETPVGEICPGCQKPIREGDVGMLIPNIGLADAVKLGAYHRNCFLRLVGILDIIESVAALAEDCPECKKVAGHESWCSRA